MISLEQQDESLDWIKIETILADFESARRSDRVSLHDYLPSSDDAYYLPILCELIRVDLELSWQETSPKSLEDYCQEFPMLLQSRASLSQIAFEEFRLRRATDATITAEEYARRFSIEVSHWPLPKSELIRTQLVPEVSVLNRGEQKTSESERFPEPGTCFLGFRILGEIGRGAFARVYLAEQRELASREMVLKISTEFLEESQTLASLQHTNIIPIYSIHRIGAFQAICMPYFGATTLTEILRHFNSAESAERSGKGIVTTLLERRIEATLISTRGEGKEPTPSQVELQLAQPLLDHLQQLSAKEAACWIVSELAEGLAHAHDRGIYHSDLKPANVLVSNEGRPMLFDFNLAVDSSGNQPVRGGTPYYMAPEQLKNLCGDFIPIDARTDLYALGLIFHELLCGKLPQPIPPGPFESQIHELRRLRSQDIPLQEISDPDIKAILQRCLASQPADRYASARQLIEDLDCYQQNLPLRWASEPWGMNRLRKWYRRNAWITSNLFLLFVVASLASVGIWKAIQAQQERSRLDRQTYASSLKNELLALRPRLVAPDPDPLQLRSDLERAESILEPWSHDEAKATFDREFASVFPTEQRSELHRLVFETMMQLAHGRFLLGEAETGLAWNRRAHHFADDETQSTLARWQQVRLSNHLARKTGQELLPEIDLPGNSPAAILFAVQDRIRDRDYRAALKRLQAHERELRTRADYWHLQATAHAGLGQWREAIAAYTTAMTLQPLDNEHLAVGRARASLAIKAYSQAKDDIDLAIANRPGQAGYHIDRALIRMGLNDLPGAIEDLNEVEKLRPEHTRTLFLRAQVRQKLRDFAGAARDRDAGLRQLPGDEISWIARGVAKVATDPKGALSDFEAALQLNPFSGMALQNQAHVLSERLNQIEPAIGKLNQLLELYPQDLLARAGRGVLLARSGQRDAAHRDAQLVLAAEPSPLLRFQVAGIYSLTSTNHPEDQQKAIELLAQAFREGIESTLMQGDHDFDPLRKDETFQKLVQSVQLLERLNGRPK